MDLQDRLQKLGQVIRLLTNDDVRYALAERIRSFGYVDFRDLFQSRPAERHVRELEMMLGMRTA